MMTDAAWVEDYGLEREHREFRDHFRRFVADKVEPLAALGEREHRFPVEVYAVLRDSGFLAVNFPIDLGGFAFRGDDHKRRLAAFRGRRRAKPQ